MQEGSKADMLNTGAYAVIYVLLGACFTKKSFCRENNEAFMFWMAKALMLFQSMREASFLRKTSAVPSGYFCFCRERESGKWEEEKMKCPWQENNVPGATPLNTERQNDRTPFVLQLLCVCVVCLTSSLQFISFPSSNLVLYSEKSWNCRGYRCKKPIRSSAPLLFARGELLPMVYFLVFCPAFL